MNIIIIVVLMILGAWSRLNSLHGQDIIVVAVIAEHFDGEIDCGRGLAKSWMQLRRKMEGNGRTGYKLEMPIIYLNKEWLMVNG